MATPTGQVSRWQTRIMMQPSVTSAVVAKPNSSAPSIAAIDDIASGFQLAVGFHRDAAAQIIEQQESDAFPQAPAPRVGLHA